MATRSANSGTVISSVSATCGVMMAVRCRPERMPVGQRLGVGHVEADTAEATRLERLERRHSVSTRRTSRDVHEDRPGSERRKFATADEPVRRVRERRSDEDDLGTVERLGETGRSAACSPHPARRRAAAARSSTSHVERRQQPQQLERDATGPDDDDARAVQAATDLVGLPARRADATRKHPQETERERERVLGDRLRRRHPSRSSTRARRRGTCCRRRRTRRRRPTAAAPSSRPGSRRARSRVRRRRMTRPRRSRGSSGESGATVPPPRRTASATTGSGDGRMAIGPGTTCAGRSASRHPAPRRRHGAVGCGAEPRHPS